MIRRYLRPKSFLCQQQKAPRFHTMSSVKTRVLILSDTHGFPALDSSSDGVTVTRPAILNDWRKLPTGYLSPLPEADVVLHCGDLTARSKPEEYKQTFATLAAIPSPLKLVIPGNHDKSLDDDYWEWDNERYKSWETDVAAIKNTINDARANGVQVLDEGVHTFNLANGSILTLYASPYTPQFGHWGFQYRTHEFQIPRNVDIAMTHGPPKGILDEAGPSWPENKYTPSGCASLLKSIQAAKPKIHCFGHIHEDWGAYMMQWKDDHHDPLTEVVSDRDDSDNLKSSRFIERARWLWPVDRDHPFTEQQADRLLQLRESRGYYIDTTQGTHKLTAETQTLFLNAAIMNRRYHPLQSPFIVDVDLPKTTSQDAGGTML